MFQCHDSIFNHYITPKFSFLTVDECQRWFDLNMKTLVLYDLSNKKHHGSNESHPVLQPAEAAGR